MAKKQSTASNKKTAPTSNRKKTAVRSVKEPEKVSRNRDTYDDFPDTRPDNSIAAQFVPYVLAVTALFIVVCFIAPAATGVIGSWIRTLLYGLFAGGAFAVPCLLVLGAFNWKGDYVRCRLGMKLIFSILFLISLSAMLHIWASGNRDFKFGAFWADGNLLKGGGFLGGLIGSALERCVGIVGTHIVCLSAILLIGLYLFGLTPYGIYLYIAYAIHQRKEEREEEKKSLEEKYILKKKPAPEETYPQNYPNASYPPQTPAVPENPKKKRHFSPDVSVEDTPIPKKDDDRDEEELKKIPDEPIIDEKAYEEAENDPGELPYGDGTHRVSDARFDENGTMLTEATTEKIPVSEEVPEPADPFADVPEEDIPPFDVGPAEIEKIKPVTVAQRHKEKDGDEENDIQSIFTDKDGNDVLTKFAEDQKQREKERLERGSSDPEDDSLELTRMNAAPQADGGSEKPIEKPVYVFPPVSMLNIDTTPHNTDISEELHANATKLVETLRSFKVRTKIVNVSRGPTITRYELMPDEGVRVRAIANLVDDIALNLATTGVRIEAPIPGKAAVGIEVPNKTVETVYLRELIDTPQFKNAPSRLNAALGMDVGGNPVFLDIAKMPHLLIAGATGMGKSVCINSLIVSLLYKANPDEVKLMLIDPKKVELNIYNGLPHLLVPVVSDPKKAAGSLQWAVTEMERRFALIEDVGVRDLKTYNSVTKDDPDREFLPQIVIIIDELADLMMTASEDVEQSIARLAQKARAAGLHLIIGTQRPQVSVITGLIKANIPSRISFTVASQMDSRVILDMIGAEKLIGRGDMLYAPVGSTKPIRVQGAFVSEKEVESIVEFIKAQAAGEYNAEIIESIEKNAEQCGQSAKHGGKGGLEEGFDADGEDSDPMLKAAIELAVESGKISTSLIQRRLSLGYGRAAKLIDIMEDMGIVGKPEGQKPRTVLISKQEYMEKVLREEDLL